LFRSTSALLELFQSRGDPHWVDGKLRVELGLRQWRTLAQAGQQPELGWVEIETGPRREPLVQLPAFLAPSQSGR
jgi:hypothetical protein